MSTIYDIERLQKELAELKEQMRWIPVTERLPEDEGDYIVYSPSVIGSWECVFTASGWKTRWEISHWMPLPLPPEEVS